MIDDIEFQKKVGKKIFFGSIDIIFDMILMFLVGSSVLALIFFLTILIH